ncbi:VanZ family protein [Flavobacterium rhizosphaerae]|uniref:VanZ family protein n=1 Tax=Flavobacterium rhizosphaerae TaxID=3163298 RepID=A0ABW8YX96_9FLAO
MEKLPYVIWAKVLAYMYMIALVYLTMFLNERIEGRFLDVDNVNLNLFSNKIAEFQNFSQQHISQKKFLLEELIGNIFLFLPFPFALYIVTKKSFGTLRVFTVMFCCILLIETLQFLLKIGIFDIDDMVLNSTGGLIGLGLFNYLRKDKK